jgi:hypothetical protein
VLDFKRKSIELEKNLAGREKFSQCGLAWGFWGLGWESGGN